MKKIIQSYSLRIKKQVIVFYEVSKHPNTPVLAKTLVIIALGYALSPIDLIPDFIPILGYLDDLIILPLLFFLAVKFIPNEVWEDCVVKAEQNPVKLPKNWLVGILIIVIWVGITLFLTVACIRYFLSK